jgi:cysteine dioxygenase
MFDVEPKLNLIEQHIAKLLIASSDSEKISLIKNMPIQLSDVIGYRYFDEKSYTRNLVFSCADFEVILMCWGSGQHSVVHDHNGSLCVMKCLLGTLDEQRFEKRLNTQSGIVAIEPTGSYSLIAGSTTSILDEEGLHSIANSRQEDACSLHFYFPPIKNAYVYGLDNVAKKAVSSVFTSEFGIKRD